MCREKMIRISIGVPIIHRGHIGIHHRAVTQIETAGNHLTGVPETNEEKTRPTPGDRKS
jgi:hypothetical protein